MNILSKVFYLKTCLTSMLIAQPFSDDFGVTTTHRLKRMQPKVKAKSLRVKNKTLKTKRPLKGVDKATGFDDPSNMAYFVNYVKAASRYAFDKANSADRVKYFTSKTAGKLKDPNSKTKNRLNQVTANFMPLMQLGNYSREILGFMGVTYDPKNPSKPSAFPTIIADITGTNGNSLASLTSRMKKLENVLTATSLGSNSVVNTAITTALGPIDIITDGAALHTLATQQTILSGLDGRTTTIENAGYQTAAQVSSAITTALSPIDITADGAALHTLATQQSTLSSLVAPFLVSSSIANILNVLIPDTYTVNAPLTITQASNLISYFNGLNTNGSMASVGNTVGNLGLQIQALVSPTGTLGAVGNGLALTSNQINMFNSYFIGATSRTSLTVNMSFLSLFAEALRQNMTGGKKAISINGSGQIIFS